MNDSISHIGKVVDISADTISVEILSESACASCHARMMCSAADGKVKIIQLPRRQTDNYSVGDRVNVILKRTMGYKAVWISYVIPLIILMVLLLTLSQLLHNELVTGIAGIVGVMLYYFIVYLCRGKLEKDFVFTIENL